ncbi:MAG: hypothetical protein JWP71_1573 [Mucilaginibacter sp.]|nr:hypothetical protein [Mucilaginibacter sp.]
MVLIISVLATLNTQAQELMKYQEPKEYTLPPKLIPTPRKYWVSLPKDYDQTTVSYPIIFLFDGDETFLRNSILATTDYLTNFLEMPPCIIVGVIQRNRVLDFGPLYAVKNNPSSGKVNGDKFFDFLKQELLPELTKNFRTQNFKIGIGHSLGGLFLTHSFTKDPEFFNGIIAISPALELQRDSILFADLKSTLRSNIHNKTFFCWGSGTEGINEVAFKPGSVALGKLFAQNPNPRFTYNYVDLPGKNHNTTPLFTIPEALAFIFKDWNMNVWFKDIFAGKIDPDLAMASRQKLIKDSYGFDIDPVEVQIQDAIGNEYMTLKKYDKAQLHFEKAIQVSPNQHDLYSDLGLAMEKLKNYKDALANLKTGFSKLDKTDKDYPDRSELYQKDIKRIEALFTP